VLLAVALAAASCTYRDAFVNTNTTVTSGDWQIETQADAVTGRAISSAFVSTRQSSNANEPFQQPATLQLGCFMDKPIVSFIFTFKVGTNLNSYLGYRFDSKPGHEIAARFVQGAMSVVIEEPAEVAQFVGELATSKSLYIRIRSLNAGRSSAAFKVEGAPAAISAAFATCPVSPAPLPPRTAALR
jgi:hypothetical protein